MSDEAKLVLVPLLIFTGIIRTSAHQSRTLPRYLAEDPFRTFAKKETVNAHK